MYIHNDTQTCIQAHIHDLYAIHQKYKLRSYVQESKQCLFVVTYCLECLIRFGQQFQLLIKDTSCVMLETACLLSDI